MGAPGAGQGRNCHDHDPPAEREPSRVVGHPPRVPQSPHDGRIRCRAVGDGREQRGACTEDPGAGDCGRQRGHCEPAIFALGTPHHSIQPRGEDHEHGQSYGGSAGRRQGFDCGGLLRSVRCEPPANRSRAWAVGLSANAARYRSAAIAPATATGFAGVAVAVGAGASKAACDCACAHRVTSAELWSSVLAAWRCAPAVSAACRRAFRREALGLSAGRVRRPGEHGRQRAAGSGESWAEPDLPGELGVLVVCSQPDFALVADERGSLRDAVAV